MVKKWSRLPLCAVMAAFVLAAFGACSDGDSGGSSGGRSVLARYGSEVDGAEVTFYDDSTFVLKEDGATAKAVVVMRALSKITEGTYTGDPVTGEGLACTAAGAIIVVEPFAGGLVVNGKPIVKVSTSDTSGRTFVSRWRGGKQVKTDEVTIFYMNEIVTLYSDGTYIVVVYRDDNNVDAKETVGGTYRISGNTVAVTFPGGSGTLTISDDGNTMTMTNPSYCTFGKQ